MKIIQFRTSWISDALSVLGRLLPGGSGGQATTSSDVAIGIQTEIGPTAPLPRTKHWSAVQGYREPEPELVKAVRDGFSAAARLSTSAPLNEATTGAVLIDKVLFALGYWPFKKEIEENRKRPDYIMTEQSVGLEIKRYTPIFDQITSSSGNKNFTTIADQVIAYLNQFQLQAMLYSNARFWWRIERDDLTGELFALRFNMNLAYNQLRNFGRSDHLKYFVPLFHAKAFRDGNNYAFPISMGHSQKLDPHGVIWLKDLNQGFGRLEM